MMSREQQLGFSLIEALVASALFMVIMVAVSGLFIQVISLQRRAQGAARVQENALFVVETVAREVRVSTIITPSSDCSSGSEPIAASSILIEHPVNGSIEYRLTAGIVERGVEGEFSPITSPDVVFTELSFIVNCSAGDDEQARVTLSMTLENDAVIERNRIPVSVQTTVVSRDLVTDLTN